MSESAIEIPAYGEPKLDLEKPQIKSLNTSASLDDSSYYPTSNPSNMVTRQGRKPTWLERLLLLLRIDSLDSSLIVSNDNYTARDSRTLMKQLT